MEMYSNAAPVSYILLYDKKKNRRFTCLIQFLFQILVYSAARRFGTTVLSGGHITVEEILFIDFNDIRRFYIHHWNVLWPRYTTNHSLEK